jgi:hypothetical protein
MCSHKFGLLFDRCHEGNSKVRLKNKYVSLTTWALQDGKYKKWLIKSLEDFKP